VTELVQLTFGGLGLGVVYALVALGFVVVYRASQVFNFAQGELLAFGAFAMTSLAAAGVPWIAAVLGAMAATGLVAAGCERLVLRRMIGRPVFVTIILTIFIGFVLRALVVIVWGTDPRGVPTPWDTTAVLELGEARVLWNTVAAEIAAAVALAALALFSRYSRLGVAMRATSDDQEVSLALGIPVGRVFGASWFVAGALAALAGVFLGMFPRTVDSNLGFVALRAFPAVIVGGLDSPVGTVIAALSLGVLEVLTQGYVNERLGQFGHGFHAVLPYLVMILFLMVRPYGLLGRRQVERV